MRRRGAAQCADSAVVAMLRGLFQQLNCGAPTFCGGGPLCGKEKEPSKQDAGLAEIFTLLPLDDDACADAEEATQRGVRLLHEGRAHEALRELHAAQRRERNSHEACSNLGCAYHMSGNDESAISWYREAQSIAPHNETAVLALAHLEHRRGMVDEAQWLLVNFLQEVNKNHVGALRQLGKLYEQERDWSQAAGVYNRLLAAEPANPEWRLQLQQCLDMMPLGNGSPAGGGVGAQLHEASRLRDTGSSDAAAAIYQAVLRNDPRNAEAALGLADCHADLNDSAAALQAVKQFLGSKPDHCEANLRVAELLLASGHPAENSEPYLQRAANDPKRDQALQVRLLCAHAEIALAREDYVSALRNAAEAVRIDASSERSSPRALVLLGTVRLLVAEYPPALKTLQAAVEACSQRGSATARRLRAQAHALMAQAHERQREYAQALAQAQKALDLEPQLSRARVGRAMALQGSGRGAEAESELNAVLQRSPTNAQARLQLGYIQLSREDPKAVATLEAVVTGSNASRSALGAAKVYLSLALESINQSRSSSRSERVLKEGLQLHRNLQHVWREIENGSVDQPLEAVQRLRGICDLDLTSLQARMLLGMLARVSDRSDLQRALSSITPPRPQRGSVQRQPSVPPMRWAPTSEVVLGGSGGYPPASPMGRHRSMSPAPWEGPGPGLNRANSLVVGSQGLTNIAWGSGSGGGSVPRSMSQVVQGPPFGGSSPLGSQVLSRPGDQQRGRSISPSPWMGSHGSLRDSSGQRAGSRERRNTATTVELGWNEVIRPEQLTFGPPLGAGGSAQVFRGSWQGQEVAIKKISGVAHLEEMTKEINALRRLRHPRLVRFIGACLQPPLLLVVTEFMAGGSLHDRIFEKKGHPLSGPQRSCIACQMVEGLVYLHANRIVHRDMKSMNILLDSAGNAKICDFGLAQQMRTEVTHMTRKTEGEGGSPRYMAPECYDPRHGKLTEKVDIWAAGCILIEIFAGILPYADCVTMAQLSARILVQKQPPGVPSSVQPALAAAIKTCFAFDEKRRPSAADLLAQLNATVQR